MILINSQLLSTFSLAYEDRCLAVLFNESDVILDIYITERSCKYSLVIIIKCDRLDRHGVCRVIPAIVKSGEGMSISLAVNFTHILHGSFLCVGNVNTVFFMETCDLLEFPSVPVLEQNGVFNVSFTEYCNICNVSRCNLVDLFFDLGVFVTLKLPALKLVIVSTVGSLGHILGLIVNSFTIGIRLTIILTFDNEVNCVCLRRCSINRKVFLIALYRGKCRSPMIELICIINIFLLGRYIILGYGIFNVRVIVVLLLIELNLGCCVRFRAVESNGVLTYAISVDRLVCSIAVTGRAIISAADSLPVTGESIILVDIGSLFRNLAVSGLSNIFAPFKGLRINDIVSVQVYEFNGVVPVRRGILSGVIRIAEAYVLFVGILCNCRIPT